MLKRAIGYHLLLLWPLLTWLLAAGSAAGQEPDLGRILERLEKVERRNEELENELDRLRQQVVPTSASFPGPAATESLTPELVQEIVKNSLKEEEAKQKNDAEPHWLEVGKDLQFTVSWRDGFWAQTKDRAFRFNVGGRVDFDNTWYSVPDRLNTSIGLFNNLADPFQGMQDGAEFRRARLRFQGYLYEVMEFTCEYDFANFLDLRRRTLGISPPGTSPFDFEPVPGTRFTDVWMGFNELPVVGTFRAGHQKEWITFTNATSGRFLTFIERPLLFDAFNNDFQFSDGFTVQRNFFDQRMYFWAGLFRVNSNFGAFDAGDGDYAYDARLTCVPVWNEDCRRWVHLGADFSYRVLHLQQTRFRARPQVFGGQGFQTPNIVNTGTVFGLDGEQVVNFEYASAIGPLTLTSEFTLASVPNAFTGGLPLPNGNLPPGAKARGNFLGKGWYIESLYFLTGEHRGYRPEQPSYDRIRPAENFFLTKDDERRLLCGRGAWEVGVRYDWLDLTDVGINGGMMQAVTLGLNWHLNPNMKVQWNYVRTRRDFLPTDDLGRVAGDFSGFGMRFHWDF